MTAVQAEELLPLTEVQVAHVLSGHETRDGAEAISGSVPAATGGPGAKGVILGRGRRTNPMRRGSDRS